MPTRLVAGRVLRRHAVGVPVRRVTAAVHLNDLRRDAFFELANLKLPLGAVRDHDDAPPSVTDGRVTIPLTKRPTAPCAKRRETPFSSDLASHMMRIARNKMQQKRQPLANAVAAPREPPNGRARCAQRDLTGQQKPTP